MNCVIPSKLTPATKLAIASGMSVLYDSGIARIPLLSSVAIVSGHPDQKKAASMFFNNDYNFEGLNKLWQDITAGYSRWQIYAAACMLASTGLFECRFSLSTNSGSTVRVSLSLLISPSGQLVTSCSMRSRVLIKLASDSDNVYDYLNYEGVIAGAVIQVPSPLSELRVKGADDIIKEIVKI